jgi:hypothetical protein
MARPTFRPPLTSPRQSQALPQISLSLRHCRSFPRKLGDPWLWVTCETYISLSALSAAAHRFWRALTPDLLELMSNGLFWPTSEATHSLGGPMAGPIWARAPRRARPGRHLIGRPAFSSRCCSRHAVNTAPSGWDEIIGIRRRPRSAASRLRAPGTSLRCTPRLEPHPSARCACPAFGPGRGPSAQAPPTDHTRGRGSP